MAIRKAIWLTLYGGCVLAIGGECWAGYSSIPTADAAPALTHPAPVKPPVLADAGELSRAVLDRPLFAESRRPPPPPPAPVKTVAAPIEPPKARLAGTITTGVTKVAFFDDAPAKQVSLSIGGNLGAWHVIAIYPGRVTMRADDGSVIVKSMTGTIQPLMISAALRNWKPAPFHREE